MDVSFHFSCPVPCVPSFFHPRHPSPDGPLPSALAIHRPDPTSRYPGGDCPSCSSEHRPLLNTLSLGTRSQGLGLSLPQEVCWSGWRVLILMPICYMTLDKLVPLSWKSDNDNYPTNKQNQEKSGPVNLQRNCTSC